MESGRSSRSGSFDSDDSGFGEQVPSFLAERVQKMRSMMTLAKPIQEKEIAHEEDPTPLASSTVPMPASNGLSQPSAASEPPAKVPRETSMNGHTAQSRSQLDLDIIDREQVSMDAKKDKCEAMDKTSRGMPYTSERSTSEETAEIVDAFAQHCGVESRDKEPVDAGNHGRSEDSDEKESVASEEETYTVHWKSGVLGLLFKANQKGRTVIRRVNKKGNARGLHFARAGDELVSINGRSLEGVSHQDVLVALQEPEFPAVLVFRPMEFEEDSVAVLGPGSMSASSPTASNHTADSASHVDVRSMERHTIAGGSLHSSLNADRQSWLGRAGSSNEYDVVWDMGPLGCGLKQKNGLPVVKTVTGASVCPSVAQIRDGDVLILINGRRTEEIGFKGAIEILQRAPKPVQLRFRKAVPAIATPSYGRPSEPIIRSSNQEMLRDSLHSDGSDSGALKPNQYAVLWSEGPLGVQIKKRSDGRVIVARITGIGSNDICEQVAVGDIFVRIAGVDIADVGLSTAFELLKSVKKPVVLVFERAEAPVPSFRELRKSAAMRASSSSDGAGSADKARPSEAAPPPQPSTYEDDAPQLLHENESSNSYTDEYTYSRDVDSIDASLPPPPPYPSSSAEIADVPPPPPYPSSSADMVDVPPPPYQEVNKPHRPHAATMGSFVPPPAYSDVFTASGRARDPSSFCVASSTHSTLPPPPPLPPVPSPAPVAAPSRHSEMSRSQSAVSRPTSSFHVDADAGRGAPPPYPKFVAENKTTEELRQMYLEAQRRHNQSPAPAIYDTMVSTYSDLDDSGVMRERNRSRPAIAAGGLPELWIEWSEGPLGITFKRSNGQVVVSRLTGAGYSRGIDQLRAGDWLVSFANYSTADLKLPEVMALLKKLPKPLHLRFVLR